MIVLEKVRKSFGGITVLGGADLVIPDGAQVALLGPSGCGKTTLLRLIAGLDMPDEGTVSINGRIASGPGVCVPPSERRVGFVFQSAALWPHLTVADTILFGLRNLAEVEQEERLAELLDRMDIGGIRDRYPDQISGGQARRVALARALAVRPSILLCDEPLTSLDRPLRDALIRLIADMSSAYGSSLLYVTHDEYEAEAVAERILRLEKGKITG